MTLITLGTVATASKAGNKAPTQTSATAEAAQTLPASDAEQLAFSRYLKQIGALFYGAWWCPACMRQKALFGEQAVQELPYVECDKVAADRDRCMAAGIKVFPTWELKGKDRLEGVQSLDALKRWSGYGR